MGRVGSALSSRQAPPALVAGTQAAAAARPRAPPGGRREPRSPAASRRGTPALELAMRAAARDRARRQRRVKLGHPRREDGEAVLTLAEARDKAREVQKSAAEGKLDGAKEVAATSNSFRAVAADYLKHLAANQRPRTVREARRMLEKDLAAWRDLPAASITSDQVRALRDAIAERGAEVQSNRMLARLHALFRWAADERRVAANPAAGVKKRTKEQARDRVLGDDEIRWFWAACGEMGWPFGHCAQLLLLTAQRRQEVGAMRWGEVELNKRTWTLPRHRAKNDQAHVVHLSDAAVQILDGLAEQRARIAMLKASDLVFTWTGTSAISGFSRAKVRFDAAMLRAREADGSTAEIAPWTLHDFRPTTPTAVALLSILPLF